MKRSPLLRYGVAVLAVALALLIKLLLGPFIEEEESPFLLFFVPVVVSAWLGGLRAGLLATALSALVSNYFFLSPSQSFRIESFGQGLRIALFVLEGTFVSWLVATMHSAKRRAEASTLEAQSRQEDLRRSEERFRLLVEGVKDYAIFMLDPGGRIVSWNAGAERIKGYKAEEIVGEHFSRFYPSEDVRRGRPEQELEAAAEGRIENEGWRVRKDGSRFYADAVITALRDEAGNLRGFSKVTRDITEHKRAKEKLHRSLNSLLALYEAGQILGSTLEREEIGSRVLEIMRGVSGLTAAIISTEGERGQLRIWRAAGLEGLWRRARYAAEAEDARRAVLETGEYRLFRLRRPSSETGHLVGLCLPLRMRERIAGVLEAYGPESLAEKDAISILDSLTAQAASALENARLYEEMAEHERQLKDLLAKLLGAQEEERRRLAYEVHDGLTQLAVATYQHLQAFADDHPPHSTRGREQLEESLELAQQTAREARRVIAGLRPTVLDDRGLATAIRLQVEALLAEGWRVSYEATLGDERLPPALETTLFRVAQEALTNVRKHAQTTRVDVRLQRLEGTVRLQVKDWGQGFQPDRARKGGGPGERVGLSSMHERVALLGGNFEVRSKPGRGTSIVVDIPLPEVGIPSPVSGGCADHEE